MKYRGISWNIVEKRRVLCENMQYRRRSWKNIEYHGILWNIVNVTEERIISWNIVEYHGISLQNVEYQSLHDIEERRISGIPWNIVEYH